jgi:hypothetical protein
LAVSRQLFRLLDEFVGGHRRLLGDLFHQALALLPVAIVEQCIFFIHLHLNDYHGCQPFPQATMALEHSTSGFAYPALQSHGLFEKRQVGEIFGTRDKFFALMNASQGKHRHLLAEPPYMPSALEFQVKASQPIHPVKEINQRAVTQLNHGIGPDRGGQAEAKAEHSHVLPRRQINPEVRIQGGGRHALENRGAHAGDLKPYFFLAERVNKSCERRKFSCNCHRSSGEAARLRAKRYFSSSLRPGTFRILFRTRAIFFSTI